MSSADADPIWKKDSSFLAAGATSSIRNQELGVSSNFPNYGMIPNSNLFGLTNNGNQANNSANNFEQLHSSPERLLKMQMLIENGVGYVCSILIGGKCVLIVISPNIESNPTSKLCNLLIKFRS